MVGSFISIMLLDMGLRIMVVDSFWGMGSWVEGDGERGFTTSGLRKNFLRTSFIRAR